MMGCGVWHWPGLAVTALVVAPFGTPSLESSGWPLTSRGIDTRKVSTPKSDTCFSLVTWEGVVQIIYRQGD
jgi:hypothetical protein